MFFKLLKKKDKFEQIEKKLFDKKYYKNSYSLNLHEKNLFKHYRETGWKLNFNPNEWFSVKDYLEQNKDVANANMDPFYHFIRFGLSEGRQPIRVVETSNGTKTTNSIKGNKIKSCIEYPNSSVIHSNKILIIATYHLSQCKLYRVDSKIEELKKIGFEVDCFSFEDRINCINALQTAELVIIYRLPWIDPVCEYFSEAKRLGLKIIYDIDDVIFDQEIYDEMLSACDLPVELKNKLSNEANLYAKCLSLADEVWVTTKTLKDIIIQKYKKVCSIVPNGINSVLNNYMQEANSFYKQKNNNNDVIKLFYGSGTNTHNEDILSIMPVLDKILNEYSNVHLYLVGEFNIHLSDEIKRQVHFVDKVLYEDYYYLISKYDIALIPLVKRTFNEAKSNIKFIEASILGIPSIASNMIEYSSVITDGKNGYLANNNEEWYEKLKSLIESEELRNKLSNQAKADVKKLYSYDVISNTIIKQILYKYIDKSSYQTTKKNILIVNVLYGISSFGGATVVTEGLAENIQKLSDYNVYVFSTHSDKHLPYGTVMRYNINNVEVFSVNVPYISKSYSNKEIGRVFQNILTIVNPVLVHFHCIQTMGLEMAEQCLSSSIPYVVTIHDGWWRCNNQFLIDSSEKYCGDKDLSCELCNSRCGLKNIDFYNRLHKCEKILSGAQIVYTPSKYFTDFSHKDFPSANFKTNTNGIIDCLYKGNKSAKERSSKLVFGFLGGKDYVKGFDFIQKILNKKDSSKFSLLLIDTAKREKSTGLYKIHDVNCETEIIGYTPHEKMLDVYSKIDVLLFPSKGKESFGLVVREAIANDVFVISSRCGGPSEAVIDGENGFLFDLGDIDMFEKCIDKVLSNISYYINYKTTNFGDVRSFASQSQDLIHDYDSILKKKMN